MAAITSRSNALDLGRRRILIFGGSFDPIHLGHIKLLKRAISVVRPEKSLVIPSADQPAHKTPCLFPVSIRTACIQISLAKVPNWAILDYETIREAPAYTWETLRFLKQKFQDAQFYLVVGSDNVHAIRKWKNARDLLGDKKLTVVAAQRPGWPLSTTLKPAGGLIKLDGRYPDISSTEIRGMLTSNDASERRQAWSRLSGAARLPLRGEEGLVIIAQAYIKRHLPQSRYAHSLSVAQLAADLAQRWHGNERGARLAGLLHDSSRTQENFQNFNDAMSHAQRSAGIARTIIGVKDPAILEAIRCHTLGLPGMPLLAKILFVADFASPDRTFPEADQIRLLARRDLNAALCAVAAHKLHYLLRQNRFIHPKALAYWNSLVGKP